MRSIYPIVTGCHASGIVVVTKNTCKSGPIMNRVLVTGATGYVGKALCAFLAAKGYQVLAMTRQVPDAGEQVEGVSYLQSDYQSFDVLHEQGQIDAVIHLAARAHVLDKDHDASIKLFRAANVDLTIKLARKAFELNISRFIFISTIGVNGNYTLGESVFDEASCPAPHSPYAMAKFEAEKKLHELLGGKDLAYTILRLPLIYSAEAPGNFKKLLGLVSKGLPLPFSAVQNKRSLLSLQNLLDCIERCCWHDGAKGQLFLVADDQAVSTSEIISCLAKGMKKSIWQFPLPKIIFRVALRLSGKQSMFVQLFEDLVIDNSKVKMSLQWEPASTIYTALETSGHVYLQNLGESN